MVGRLEIRNLTRRGPVGDRRLFAQVATSVLPGWEVSLVFVGATRARTLNRTLRGKDYTPNVLSYAVSDRSGEILICLDSAARGAKEFGLSVPHFVLLLFIHGLLHLEGRRHSATMEKYEQQLLARFLPNRQVGAGASARTSSHVPPNRNWNRHRYLSGQDRHRRRSR